MGRQNIGVWHRSQLTTLFSFIRNNYNYTNCNQGNHLIIIIIVTMAIKINPIVSKTLLTQTVVFPWRNQVNVSVIKPSPEHFRDHNMVLFLWWWFVRLTVVCTSSLSLRLLLLSPPVFFWLWSKSRHQVRKCFYVLFRRRFCSRLQQMIFLHPQSWVPGCCFLYNIMILTWIFPLVLNSCGFPSHLPQDSTFQTARSFRLQSGNMCYGHLFVL